jgi:hypothetical protein
MLLVPAMPLLTMWAFAWWGGNLAATFSGGWKRFAKNFWAVYRLYATPGIVGALTLACLGEHRHRHRHRRGRRASMSRHAPSCVCAQAS